MTVINASVAAATAVVGYDLLKDMVLSSVNYGRNIRYIGLCGSAVIGDCKAELFIGANSVGEFRNTKLGFASGINTDFIEINAYVPANTKVSMIVRTAPTTNPLNPTLVFNP